MRTRGGGLLAQLVGLSGAVALTAVGPRHRAALAAAPRRSIATALLVEITCPDGVAAGGVVSVQGPSDGASYNVRVPDGIETGMRFQVELPDAPAAAAAPPPPAAPEYRTPNFEVVREEESGGGSLLDSLLPREKNPYVTTKADRMRADPRYGESSVVGRSGRSGGRFAAEDRLADDIARFKAERGLGASSEEDEEAGLLQNVINTLGNVLTVNFGIIICFFTWFLTGVGAQYGAQNTAIIDAFRGAWEWLIMPLLTTHMTLTFLSWGLEKVAQKSSA